MKRSTITALGLAVVGGVVATQVARRRRPPATPLAILEGGDHHKVETSDGAVLAAHVAGDGPPVVLAHGWTNSMATWDPVAVGLVERGFSVIRYDQRGHGGSTIGSDGQDIARLGADLADVLAAFDVRDAVVAGHSMGGMAVQSFAIDHPDVAAERVAALVLVATAGSELGRPALRLAPYAVGSPVVSRLLAGRRGVAFMRGTHGRSANPLTVATTRDLFVATPADVRRAQLRSIFAMDLREGHASIAVPTTVVIGSRDTLCPPARGRAIAAAIPGARLVEVRGAGHMLPYESVDVLVDLIADLHPARAS